MRHAESQGMHTICKAHIINNNVVKSKGGGASWREGNYEGG